MHSVFPHLAEKRFVNLYRYMHAPFSQMMSQLKLTTDKFILTRGENH